MPSHDAKIHYSVEDGVALIEIRLSTVDQLFNSLDPSPFHEKDLDADAEDYIVGATDDLPISAPLKLVFLLPGEEVGSAGAGAPAEAIHHYFAYTLAAARRDVAATSHLPLRLVAAAPPLPSLWQARGDPRGSAIYRCAAGGRRHPGRVTRIRNR